MKSAPFFTDDFTVFGILMLLLGFVFYTSSLDQKFWKKFYVIFPTLLMCYLLPSIMSTLNIISPEWLITDASGATLLNDEGEALTGKLQIYKVASRLLLPAALILLTLSIDLKALFKLGSKALIMFITGTVGVIIGGPIAILLVSMVAPEVVGGVGPDAVWRGLATIAGSWIGGGANQTAMLEIFKYNQQNYGAMVLVDIIVANIWMAVLLFGISRKEKIDAWLKADTSAIEDLKVKVTEYTASVTKVPTLQDYMEILALTFAGVGLAHWGSTVIPIGLKLLFPIVGDPSSMMATFGDSFFWLVTISTFFGVVLSFTKAKEYEGVGASKIGSIFIYILVAAIGMKMDLSSVVSNPGLLVVGIIWISVHAILLIIVAKIIRAPYFFLTVGSQANIGGAASAPIVASAFHPSLAGVGVLLAIFGYIVGTYGAILAAVLMELAAPIG